MATAVRFEPLPCNVHNDPGFQALLAKMGLDDWKRKVAAIILLAALVILVASACATVGPPIQKPCFHANESSERDIGYCQAVRVGNTLYIAGTAGEGDMGSAIRSVYDRLQKTLEANGLTFANVVKENVYATDLDAFIQNKDLRKKFYGQTFPVATWVQVQRLYVPSLVVEVELTAVYGK
jgi:2-iminobutanoate/2-iminopropanoate deaminase